MSKYAFIGAIILTTIFYGWISFILIFTLLTFIENLDFDFVEIILIGSAGYFLFSFSLFGALAILLLIITRFLKKRKQLFLLIFLSLIYLITLNILSDNSMYPLELLYFISCYIGMTVAIFWYRNESITDLEL